MTFARMMAALTLFVAALGVPAVAQERLFVYRSTAPTYVIAAEIGTAPGELGAIKQVLRTPEDFFVRSITPLAGGRYLAVTRTLVHTFGLVQLYFSSIFRSGAFIDTQLRVSSGSILASDPRTPRLFLADQDVETGRTRVIGVSPDPVTVSPLAFELPASGISFTVRSRVAYTPGRSWLLIPTSAAIH